MQQLLVRPMQTSYAMTWQTIFLRRQCLAAYGKVLTTGVRAPFKGYHFALHPLHVNAMPCLAVHMLKTTS